MNLSIRALVMCVPALAGALSIALPSAEAEAKARAKRCGKPGTTVLVNTTTRVYVKHAADDYHYVYACLRGSRTHRRVASWFSCGCSIGDDSEPQLWLAGRTVAVNAYSCSPIDPMAGCTGTVRSLSVRTGRTLRSADGGGYLSELVLRPGGSFAYPVFGQIRRVDSRGQTTVEAPGIQPGSLALAGSIYWTGEGGAHSTDLL